MVPGRAVPLSESSRALDPGPVCGLLKGRTLATVGPNRSSSKSIGGEIFVSVRIGRTFLRGGGEGVLLGGSMLTGRGGRAGTFAGFAHLSSSSNLTVFFELADAGEPGVRGVETLGLGWKKPCPSGPFLDFSTFFIRASRGTSSFGFVSQMAMASSRS
jgi:hypothetical protein